VTRYYRTRRGWAASDRREARDGQTGGVVRARAAVLFQSCSKLTSGRARPYERSSRRLVGARRANDRSERSVIILAASDEDRVQSFEAFPLANELQPREAHWLAPYRVRRNALSCSQQL
jgi:hypothetical protein